MKWLGALLVLLSALAFGQSLCLERKRHTRLLRDLLECMELLQGELELSAAPIRELLQRLSERSPAETGAFLDRVSGGMDRLGEESFALIWRQAAECSFPLLCQQEREELIRLGPILGALDLEAQLRALRYCSAFLRERLEEERRSYPVKRRLTLGLCVCGASLAIILTL